ncbi:MAG: hypothetical protein ACLFTP_11955 [Rhodosalinus sp.]
MSEQLWQAAREPMPEDPGELPLILARKLRVAGALADCASVRIEFAVRREHAAIYAQAFEGRQAIRERERLEAALAAEHARRRQAERDRRWAIGNWAVLCAVILVGQLLEVLP